MKLLLFYYYYYFLHFCPEIKKLGSKLTGMAINNYCGCAIHFICYSDPHILNITQLQAILTVYINIYMVMCKKKGAIIDI